jgi:uncharacterized protein
MTPTYRTPGVYREEVHPDQRAELPTGVPVFVGYVTTTAAPLLGLTRWAQFATTFGPPRTDGYLATAVRGFFDNEGTLCYVIPLDETVDAPTALASALARLETLEDADLLCSPDIMRASLPQVKPEDVPVVRSRMQAAVLAHCENLGNCLAILDSLPGAAPADVLVQRRGLMGRNGALYYPWIRTVDGLAPPCGHVAGIYSRSDRRVGVHKAPANEVLQGVVDLETAVRDGDQADLNPAGVNCLRAFPGRGIRVWGARTISQENAWIYVNVRRMFLTAGRWIERSMAGVGFEPHNLKLWSRITRELTAYFLNLFRRGALKGATAQEAFFVKCDAETNPPEVRDAGLVVTQIGLAPLVPSEFVVVRIVLGAAGITITGPAPPI